MLLAELVDLRGAHPRPELGDLARDGIGDPEVVGLVVARAVARGEHRGELVERERSVGCRILPRAVRADELGGGVGLAAGAGRAEAAAVAVASVASAPPR